jgi:hypothetical protein
VRAAARVPEQPLVRPQHTTVTRSARCRAGDTPG